MNATFLQYKGGTFLKKTVVLRRWGVLQVIIWLQKYAHSDWLLSGHYFLVMTGHYEIFSQLDGSFDYVRVGENNRKDGQSTTIFSITERKTSTQILL